MSPQVPTQADLLLLARIGLAWKLRPELLDAEDSGRAHSLADHGWITIDEDGYRLTPKGKDVLEQQSGHT